jgi:hypothetical protein
LTGANFYVLVSFMSTHDEMAERRGRILAELSEIGLTLARELHARALAAEDAKTAADLGLACRRIARSVRETLALKAKLEREQKHREPPTRIEGRKQQLPATVRRTIWH